MKNMKPKLISLLVCFCIINAGMVLAEKTGEKFKHLSGMPPRHGHPGLAMLMRYQHDRMAAEVVSEITGQSLETITVEMDDTHFPEVIENYGIDPETFRSAMDQKVIQSINNAAEDGRITEAQAAGIIEKIENRLAFPWHVKPDSTR